MIFVCTYLVIAIEAVMKVLYFSVYRFVKFIPFFGSDYFAVFDVVLYCSVNISGLKAYSG